MKPKTKALLIAPLIAMALVAALLIFPSSSTQETRLVLASSDGWPNTYISVVRLRSTTIQVAVFYATGETVYLEVGENINEIRATVLISKSYASSSSEAMANTKVHGTITHPTQGTIFTDWLDAIETGPWPDYYTVVFSKQFSTHTLVAGTYTITTTYQVYA